MTEFKFIINFQKRNRFSSFFFEIKEEIVLQCLDENLKKQLGCIKITRFPRKEEEIVLQCLEENRKKPRGCFQW